MLYHWNLYCCKPGSQLKYQHIQRYHWEKDKRNRDISFVEISSETPLSYNTLQHFYSLCSPMQHTNALPSFLYKINKNKKNKNNKKKHNSKKRRKRRRRKRTKKKKKKKKKSLYINDRFLIFNINTNRCPKTHDKCRNYKQFQS